mgnify:CR=1 FL=1
MDSRSLYDELRRLAPSVRNSVSIWALAEYYAPDGDIGDIRMATDADLSCIYGFGRAALRTLRMNIPAPYLVPAPLRGQADTDAWRDHAEMVAGSV